MDTIKMHPKFTMSEYDLEYLDGLPPNEPGDLLGADRKERIQVIYKRYFADNGVKGINGGELFRIALEKKWSDGTRMVETAAKRIVLDELKALQVFPTRTIFELAQRYKLALLLDEVQRVLLFSVYDFQ